MDQCFPTGGTLTPGGTQYVQKVYTGGHYKSKTVFILSHFTFIIF
jgi:hypothetical protein